MWLTEGVSIARCVIQSTLLVGCYTKQCPADIGPLKFLARCPGIVPVQRSVLLCISSIGSWAGSSID